MIQLSILTPAVPSRWDRLQALTAEIERQIGDLPVEHLVLMDNRRRSIGRKRDALLRAARGEYIAFVDDDDAIRPEYIAQILGAIQADAPDVVTFQQLAVVDGVRGVIEFRLGQRNEPFRSTSDGHAVKRCAWHVCAWRRDLAICSHFPDSNYGEDIAFAGPLNAMAKTEAHIPQILHEYRYAAEISEAPPPKANGDHMLPRGM